MKKTVGILTGENTAQKEILHVFSPQTPHHERQARIRDLQDQVDLFEARYPRFKGTLSFKTVADSDPVKVIIAEAVEHEYVVLGATRDSWLKRQFFGSKPRQIAQNIDVPVALIRPRTPLLGFGLRQILNYLRGGYRHIEPSSETALQELGILRPPSERHRGPLRTAVNKGRLLVVGGLAIVSVVHIYLGGGELWTWVGSVVFLALLFVFTWISIRPSADPMPE